MCNVIINFPLLIWFLSHVHVCMHMNAGAPVCAHMHVQVRGQAPETSSGTSSTSFETGCLTGLELIHQARLAGQKPRQSSCLWLSSWDYDREQLYPWILGTELRSSGFRGMHFTNKAISPVSPLPYPTAVKTGSCLLFHYIALLLCVNQTGLEHGTISQPLPPKCWDCKYTSPHPAKW